LLIADSGGIAAAALREPTVALELTLAFGLMTAGGEGEEEEISRREARALDA
jgi:hypothetical protein